MKTLSVSFFALALFSATAASADSPRIPGVYSNLAVGTETGDISGTEILIVPTDYDGQYVAFVQTWTDTGRNAVIPIRADGNRVFYQVFGGDCMGLISDRDLSLMCNYRRFGDEDFVERLYLPRKHSFWE